MNPSIRYRQVPGQIDPLHFSYQPISQPLHISHQPKIYQQQQTLQKQPLLVKHKSNNSTTNQAFYQNQQFSKSYRMQPSSYSNKNQNNIYKTTANIYKVKELHKVESANDFFSNASTQNLYKISEKIKTKQIHFIQQSSKFSNQTNQYCNPNERNSANTVSNDKTYQKNTHQNTYQNIHQNTHKNLNQQSDQCSNCLQLIKQKQQIMIFMNQQLQIASKQYTDKINNIIIQQAKQIKDLRKTLINNEKNIIRLQRIQKQKQGKNSSKYNQRNISPTYQSSKISRKQKSPSKLSLTKSNHSVMAIQQGKQKLTILSKDTSPVKNNLNSNNHNNCQLNRKYSENSELFSTSQKFISYNKDQQLNVENLINKIKVLQDKINHLHRAEHQKNQKNYLLNKKIQILEKGLISIFSTKIQAVKTSMNSYISKSEQKINILYKQMKVISSKIGTMSNQGLKPLGSVISNQDQKQGLNSYSTPSIVLPKNEIFSSSSSSDINISKISIKLKNFFSQIQDLKQISQNLKTKQFKYDNFQLNSLTNQLQDLHKKVFILQKSKHAISTQMIEHEQQIKSVIQMSKFSQKSIYDKQLQGYQNKESNSIENVDNTKFVNKKNIINLSRNNSVQLSYSVGQNINFQQMGARSMKNQSSKLTKYTRNTSQNNPSFGFQLQQPYSHSQFRGFTGQNSDFSQFQQSVYNKDQCQNEDEQAKNHQNFKKDEQSFERSSSEQQGQGQEQEQEQVDQQDEFFYPVNINGQNSQQHRSSQHNNKQRNQTFPTSTIHRFMQVIQYRENKPLKIEIDQTGYIKSAQNGMYIVDRNMDGFDLNKNQLQWLREKGIVLLEH